MKGLALLTFTDLNQYWQTLVCEAIEIREPVASGEALLTIVVLEDADEEREYVQCKAWDPMFLLNDHWLGVGHWKLKQTKDGVAGYPTDP